MGTLPLANLNAELDFSAVGYIKALGTLASTIGIGDATFGARKEINSAYTDLGTVDDADATCDIASGLKQFRDALTVDLTYSKPGRSFLNALSAHALNVGAGVFTDLESWLADLNTGTSKNTALQDRYYRDFFNGAYGVFPAVGNIYFEALQGVLSDEDHLYSLGLGSFVISGAGAGTFTQAPVEGGLVDNGSALGQIDESKYAGGFPKVIASGIAGTGIVTVTGNLWNPATKAVVVGEALTVNITGNGTFVLVPATTTDGLLLEVTNMSIAAGLTAGTIYSEAHRPTGRTLVQA